MYRQNYPNDPGMHVNENTRVRYHRNPTFFERVGNSLVGVLVGTVLLFSASGLLFWNEGRAVKRARALDEGLSSVHNLHTVDVVLDENNGKLVYVTGELHTDKELSDSMYRVSVSAVKLKREVEMYQWVEHEHRREVDEGSHTREEVTYSYSQEWRPEPIGSSSFYNTVGHHNPGDFPVKTTEYTASEVKVGAFLLSKGLVEKISEYKDVEATVEPTIEGVRLYMGYYYHGSNPLQPQVGDLKVKFLYAGLTKGDNRGISAQPDTVSIIGEQRRGWLEGYQTQAGDSLELLYYGTLTPKEIFGREHAHNTMLSWGVRFGGWLLMFVGFSCITNLIAVMVDWLPIIREMVAMGMHMMSMALSISLSLTVIAIGWIVYRPFLGITILVIAASPFIISKWRMHQARSSSNRNV